MHESVLRAEAITLLAIQPDGAYLDGTGGDGGHAMAILDRLSARGRLVILDRDMAAIERLRARLGDDRRCAVVHANFRDLCAVLDRQGIPALAGIMFDVGVSSDQLAAPERGFSFMADGPLDMRMDRAARLTAATLVNEYDETALADLIWRYGEERASRRIASAVVRARQEAPIVTTGRLAAIVGAAKGGRHGRVHPATQTFQALRIAVNDELGALSEGLEAGIERLVTGGRMAVLTFHSLEDRLVKRIFREHEGLWQARQEGGEAWTGRRPAVRRVNRKPVIASRAEIGRNPRARSAKLRVIERVGAPTRGKE
jgi:16S rRNA (cytosine1402-N4)-methyltransferase